MDHFKRLFAEEQAALKRRVLKMWGALPASSKEKKTLLAAMVTCDLKTRAETRQLRNVDFKQTRLNAEQCRSKIVMTAKDQLNQKKGVTPFVFILDVLIECFDKGLDRLDLKQVETLVAALTAVPVKELMKIAEGGFFSLVANLADHLEVAGS